MLNVFVLVFDFGLCFQLICGGYSLIDTTTGTPSTSIGERETTNSDSMEETDQTSGADDMRFSIDIGIGIVAAGCFAQSVIIL